MFKCECCEKEFENYRQLNGHMRIHNDAGGSYTKKRKIKIKEVKTCKTCNILFEQGRNTNGYFCSVICDQEFRKQKLIYDVENGFNTSAPRIKDYLIAKYGNNCMDVDCVWDQKKRPVKVELDHIDGNSKNNSLTNLRLLCPCCHSLTPTYKNKNKGNGRINRLVRYHKTKILKNFL